MTTAPPHPRLVGRDGLLAAVAASLDLGVPVTLVGPGGVGKTGPDPGITSAATASSSPTAHTARVLSCSAVVVMPGTLLVAGAPPHRPVVPTSWRAAA